MKQKIIVVKDHYRSELTKVRCWIDGFRVGRDKEYMIPGEDVLRQLIVAIDEAKPRNMKP